MEATYLGLLPTNPSSSQWITLPPFHPPPPLPPNLNRYLLQAKTVSHLGLCDCLLPGFQILPFLSEVLNQAGSVDSRNITFLFSFSSET